MPESLVLISVGNTRTRLALARRGQLEPSTVLPNTDLGALVDTAVDLNLKAGASPDASESDQDNQPLIVLASVNDPVANELTKLLTARQLRPARIGIAKGSDLPIPMITSLTDDSTVGIDRLLGALGAFARSKQACIVIDAGTAVTVDFVDGAGTFHGGAIAPGLQLMLKSLHEHTAALPLVALDATTVVRPGLLPVGEPAEQVEDEIAAAEHTGPAPFGKNTQEAIILGVTSAIRGLVHELVDRYAEFYRGYPRVLATGGDAPLLFSTDPIVEHIVPDLTLIGMLAAVEKLDEEEEND